MSRSRSGRGQTTIDFAIGAGIFLLVVAFAFAFTPGALTPFVDSQQPQTADRTASKLVGGELGAPDRPYQLDRDCTVAFFDHFQGGSPDSDDCRFDDQTDSINEALGVIEFTNVNVTITYHNGSVADLQGVQLAVGDTRPAGTATTTAQRIVVLDGTVSRLVVHTW